MRLEIEDNDAEVVGELLVLLTKGADVRAANRFIREKLNTDPEVWKRVGDNISAAVTIRKERLARYGNKDQADSTVL